MTLPINKPFGNINVGIKIKETQINISFPLNDDFLMQWVKENETACESVEFEGKRAYILYAFWLNPAHNSARPGFLA